MMKQVDVLCWSAEHYAISTIALVFFGVMIAGFFAFYCYCAWVIPVRSLTNRTYITPVKFVIFRFHNGAWWWGMW